MKLKFTVALIVISNLCSGQAQLQETYASSITADELKEKLYIYASDEFEGRETGEKILEQCGSIEEMCFEESLKHVKGLGPSLRQKIMTVLTSENPVHIERIKRR